MTALNDLNNRLRSVAQEIAALVRPSNDPNFAGWGQFVDAQAHTHQIGSYGTCAAILAILSADPAHQVDPRVSAQVAEFWNAGESAGEKLRRQNVRLAFLVLCLAKTTDATLATVRGEVVQELRTRQLPSGAWGDWFHPNEPTQARADTTAWVALALARLQANDATAIRGAEYLLIEMSGAGAAKRLSPIAVAAAITILPVRQRTQELIARAQSLLDEIEGGDRENISFFDYIADDGGQTRVARDYICFPEFYPLSLILRGLHEVASVAALPRLSLRRIDAANGLLALVQDGHPYRLRGAKFAATVDQAMLFLAYENLSRCRSKWDTVVTALRPAGEWAKNSFVTRVVLPVALLAGAAVTMEDPSAIGDGFKILTGSESPLLKTWTDEYKSAIRLAVAALLLLSANVPLSVPKFIRRKMIRG